MVKNRDKRAEDPAAMGAGDSQLDLSAPNAEEVQPPAETVSSPAMGADALGERGSTSDGTGGAPASPENGVVDAALERELGALRKDLKDASDRHLRLAAEFDNYRKRVERERADVWGRAQSEIAVRLLDTLDDLERVAHHSDSANAETLLEGVQLIERKLRASLAAAGLEEVPAENASFDPRFMEAVAVVSAERPEDDDLVSDVFQRGYQFKGQLLRPARVRVKKHD